MAENSDVLKSALELQAALQNSELKLKSYSLIPLLEAPFIVAEDEVAIDFQFAKRAAMLLRRVLLDAQKQVTTNEVEQRNRLSQVFLLIQPAFATIWNQRKRALVAVKNGQSDASAAEILSRCKYELAFSGFVLRNAGATKCAEVYSHRRFVLESCVPVERRAEFALQEFAQLDELVRKTTRNYVMYAHRAWLFDFSLQQAGVLNNAELHSVELSRTQKLFESVLVEELRVDFSLLHYRLGLLCFDFSRQNLQSSLTSETAGVRELLNSGLLKLSDGSERRDLYVSEAVVAALSNYLQLIQLAERIFLNADKTV